LHVERDMASNAAAMLSTIAAKKVQLSTSPFLCYHTSGINPYKVDTTLYLSN